MPERCNCEHIDHLPDEGQPRVGHRYGALRPGSVPCQYVGQVCPDCAATHMKEYLL